MTQQTVAYLGPEGTYSELVAARRFGRAARLVPQPTILDVCLYVAAKSGRRGVIPFENSSGGAISETVDILLANHPRVRIGEELSLNVKLALLGRRGHRVQILYSHFAPLEHAASWIAAHLPDARKQAVPSTAAAARLTLADPSAAVLGSRHLAARYGLDVLHAAVQADIPNITAFLTIGALPVAGARGRYKTTLAAKLPNQPGALCTFLETFRTESVNLSRIISRPVRGSPRAYTFLVDIDGHAQGSARVQRALAAAQKTCVELRVVGAYPVRPAYTS